MFQEIIQEQRSYFATNGTKTVSIRIQHLQKLKRLIQQHEKELYVAIYEDFGKSEFETYVSELSLVYHELNLCVKNLNKWTKKKRVSSGLANFPAKSYIIPEPLGNVLVIGPWNYPIQLALIPCIMALAAGNTVLLKTSELPENTSTVIARMINSHFKRELFHVIEGGVETSTALLQHRFDKIFFTGSIPVGKVVYQAAARHLTPVTLELGGKSPTFVLADCNLKVTAQRLVWAKFLNAGQTCVAPDYILVEESIKERFLEAVKNEIERNYKDNGDISENYLRIINHKNFDRLCALIEKDKIYSGGITNRENRYIGPTVLHNISFDDKIMEDEIFGPLLPVISFTNLDDAIAEVKARSKPLALYVYSKNRRKIKKIFNEVSFGGGAVNDSAMQLSNSNLPFGGVGYSGMGSYHGKAGFDTFSHFKGILDKPFWFEPKLKYAPYSKLKRSLIKMMLE